MSGSRAKALKGLFRMTTPYLNMKDIPLLAVTHTYKEIGLFPKAIASKEGIDQASPWVGHKKQSMF